MEMPEDCFECPFGIIDDTEDGVWCNALAQQSSGQREDCPIICSLPEGHGRLIDWDAFEGIGFKLCRKTNGWKAELGTPTDESYVVPAERSEI
jgi:hypothetical protein